MTPAAATEKFLEILNFAVEPDGFRFEADTPLAKIIKPGVCHPEVFVGCAADALEIEETDLDQDKIHPDTDTVASMFERLAPAPRRE